MEKYRIKATNHVRYPMGLTKVSGGIHLCVAAKGENCRVLFYEGSKEEPSAVLDFPEESRMGEVYCMTILGEDFSDVLYCFESEGERFSDPYGRAFKGREVWGDLKQADSPLKSPVEIGNFDWENDKNPDIPYEDSIIYRIHGRGFTKHSSSGVKHKGTFQGIKEKIPYLKELGITAVELMPASEFSEVIWPETVYGNPYGVDKPDGKLNYWGYAPGFYFAPKASYAFNEKNPVAELKSLVKALHKEGIELITELFFTGKESPSLVLDAVRYWAYEFHVDGIHLSGYPPIDMIEKDPYLSRLKLLAPSWNGEEGSKRKHLGEYKESFLTDMRQVLKGDEDQMKNLSLHLRRNPKQWAAINYMANTNGFTMMDMVSYDRKHNEANGENNRDGSDYNYSWNCGAEGPTRRKKVVELRKKQLRNAFLLLFFSQGTPLFMAGDEFGNSQGGNNNAYCQDNEVSWLNWNLLKTNRDIYDFVRTVIAFRKNHPVLHGKLEPKIMDYKACGFPDMSYHGVRAWCPEYENFRRQLGVFYCGKYGIKPDGSPDDNIYAAFNMHWEPHEFDLPNLPKGERWHVAFHTDEQAVNGIYERGAEPEVTEKRFMVPERTIVVFVGR